MSPTTLERAAGPAPPSLPPHANRPARKRRRASERRLLVLGLILSALAHGLVLLISPLFIHFGPPESPPAPAPRAAEAPSGMRVYAITPTAAEAPPVEEQVERRTPEPPPLRPQPRPEAQPGEPAATDAGEPDARALSPADRLRPELHDPRLWVIPDETPLPEMTDIERVRQRVYSRIDAITDSILAGEEAARRARDWTFTDKDGKRWGLAPDGIHLGGITLPVPQLVPSNGEAAERVRDWKEIRGQADRARARDRFKQEAKAIRDRKDKERAQKKSGSGSS